MRTALVVIAALAGCTGTGDTSFIVVGGIGGTAPEHGAVAVLWTVSSATPAYSYKYGDGTSTKFQFLVDLDADPPAGAIDAAGIAVGDIVMFAEGTQVPDGKFAYTIPTLGVTMDHGLIWKDPLAPGLGTWDRAFGARYSCARCVKSTTGGLDGYELTPCAQMRIDIGGTASCAWF